jgi:uncharacterized membrane protein
MDLTVALNKLIKEVDAKNAEIHRLKAEAEIYREELSGVDASAYELNVDTDIVGPRFPDNPYNGQLYILTHNPNTLNKFNGDSWIIVDKTQNVSYTNNKIGNIGNLVDLNVPKLIFGTI